MAAAPVFDEEPAYDLSKRTLGDPFGAYRTIEELFLDVGSQEHEIQKLRDPCARDPHHLGEFALIADGAVTEKLGHRVRQREHPRHARRGPLRLWRRRRDEDVRLAALQAKEGDFDYR